MPTVKPSSGFVGPLSTPDPIGTGTEFGYTSFPIARWVTIPMQRFTETRSIGLLAFHVNGIKEVGFYCNGSTGITVTSMSKVEDINYNGQLPCYNVKVNPSDFSGSTGYNNAEFRAIITPITGSSIVLEGATGFYGDVSSKTGGHYIGSVMRGYGRRNEDTGSVELTAGVHSLLLTMDPNDEMGPYRYYVSKTGSTAGDGSISNSFGKVQQAIDKMCDNAMAFGPTTVANNGNVYPELSACQIILKDGTYDRHEWYIDSIPTTFFSAADCWFEIKGSTHGTVTIQGSGDVQVKRLGPALTTLKNLNLVSTGFPLAQDPQVDPGEWTDKLEFQGSNRPVQTFGNKVRMHTMWYDGLSATEKNDNRSIPSQRNAPSQEPEGIGTNCYFYGGVSNKLGEICLGVTHERGRGDFMIHAGMVINSSCVNWQTAGRILRRITNMPEKYEHFNGYYGEFRNSDWLEPYGRAFTGSNFEGYRVRGPGVYWRKVNDDVISGLEIQPSYGSYVDSQLGGWTSTSGGPKRGIPEIDIPTGGLTYGPYYMMAIAGKGVAGATSFGVTEGFTGFALFDIRKPLIFGTGDDMQEFLFRTGSGRSNVARTNGTGNFSSDFQVGGGSYKGQRMTQYCWSEGFTNVDPPQGGQTSIPFHEDGCDEAYNVGCSGRYGMDDAVHADFLQYYYNDDASILENVIWLNYRNIHANGHRAQANPTRWPSRNVALVNWDVVQNNDIGEGVQLTCIFSPSIHHFLFENNSIIGIRWNLGSSEDSDGNRHRYAKDNAIRSSIINAPHGNLWEGGATGLSHPPDLRDIYVPVMGGEFHNPEQTLNSYNQAKGSGGWITELSSSPFSADLETLVPRTDSDVAQVTGAANTFSFDVRGVARTQPVSVGSYEVFVATQTTTVIKSSLFNFISKGSGILECKINNDGKITWNSRNLTFTIPSE